MRQGEKLIRSQFIDDEPDLENTHIIPNKIAKDMINVEQDLNKNETNGFITLLNKYRHSIALSI